MYDYIYIHVYIHVYIHTCIYISRQIYDLSQQTWSLSKSESRDLVTVVLLLSSMSLNRLLVIWSALLRFQHDLYVYVDGIASLFDIAYKYKYMRILSRKKYYVPSVTNHIISHRWTLINNSK